MNESRPISKVRQAAGLAAGQGGRLLFGAALAFVIAPWLRVFSSASTWVWPSLGLGAGLLCISMGLLPDKRRFLADLLTGIALAALIIAGFLVRVYLQRQPHSMDQRDTVILCVSAAIFAITFLVQFRLRRVRR